MELAIEEPGKKEALVLQKIDPSHIKAFSTFQAFLPTAHTKTIENAFRKHQSFTSNAHVQKIVAYLRFLAF